MLKWAALIVDEPTRVDMIPLFPGVPGGPELIILFLLAGLLVFIVLIRRSNPSRKAGRAAGRVGHDPGQSSREVSEEEFEIPEAQRYEAQKVARKNLLKITVISFFLPPIGYLLVKEPLWAVGSMLILPFAPLVAPIHTRRIIRATRADLERAGHGW